MRQVFDWVGHGRLSIGEVCRRLTHAGEVTRTGKTVWDRSVVWGTLHNPAYKGDAAFGKTRYEPLRPRLRAQRNRPLQPRRAVSVRDVPPEEWLTIAVPALVEADLFAAVQAQLQENQRHARQSRRGARYLLQGIVQCQRCGYAFYGKPISRKAAKGHARSYAYYRCLGTDAYRFGASVSAPIPRSVRICWRSQCGKKCVPCSPSRSASLRNIAAACTPLGGPSGRSSPRSTPRSGSCGRASPG